MRCEIKLLSSLRVLVVDIVHVLFQCTPTCACGVCACAFACGVCMRACVFVRACVRACGWVRVHVCACACVRAREYMNI